MKFVVLLAALFFNVLATQAATHMSSTVGGGGRSFSGYDMEMEMEAARSIDVDMGEAQDRCTAIGVAKLASEVYT